jgi:hypothetical protein
MKVIKNGNKKTFLCGKRNEEKEKPVKRPAKKKDEPTKNRPPVTDNDDFSMEENNG